MGQLPLHGTQERRFYHGYYGHYWHSQYFFKSPAFYALSKSLVLPVLPPLVDCLLGSWPWALILIASILLAANQFKSRSDLIQFTAIGFLWLLAFEYSDDRRLFFPYTIQFAVQLFVLSPRGRPIAASSAIVALFAAIRIGQGATMIVLLVELIVATLAIASAAYYHQAAPPTTARRIVTAALGSLIAFAGLIF